MATTSVATAPLTAPSLVTTQGLRGTGKMLSVLSEQLSQCQEFWFVVAFITLDGVHCITDQLLELQRTGGQGRILASEYLGFTEPRALAALGRFDNLQIRMAPAALSLHVKSYYFRLAQARGTIYNHVLLLGSTNLTDTALGRNHEWNVCVPLRDHDALLQQLQAEYQLLWEQSQPVGGGYLERYTPVWERWRRQRLADSPALSGREWPRLIQPNPMQQAALAGLQQIRARGEDRALLISATGTGKTYLAAFDVHAQQPRRALFVAHRDLLIRNARDSFAAIYGSQAGMALLSGTHKDLAGARLVFATVQTLAQLIRHPEDGIHFSPKDFDYIVIDEVHHAGAATYLQIMAYFTPRFWLGMTATPERTQDDVDVYAQFHHQIAYEIRLQEALEHRYLVPFHYHGVDEITVNGELLPEDCDFTALVCDERVRHILHYAAVFGWDGECVRGLIFCRRIDEAKALCRAFNACGHPALALSGETPEAQRQDAILRLEAPVTSPRRVEYLFSVDLFNEGIDIPAVNQIIMLRPTQSAIVFVQQMGRGLRHSPGKRFVEIIDFIGNYTNNFLLPIALYGDRSGEKDELRRQLMTNQLPGVSTVHFSPIARARIFASIDRENIASLRNLRAAYLQLRRRLGRDPLMMDFVRFSDKDPRLLVCAMVKIRDKTRKARSLASFAQIMGAPQARKIPARAIRLLDFVSMAVADGKRLEEILILEWLSSHPQMQATDFYLRVRQETGEGDNLPEIWQGCVNLLSLQFFKPQDRASYGMPALIAATRADHGPVTHIERGADLRDALASPAFRQYWDDLLAYGRHRYQSRLRDAGGRLHYGFMLNGKYSRTDACRILNAPQDFGSTIYGYPARPLAGKWYPLFVTLNKNGNAPNYADRFLNDREFNWMSRHPRTLSSTEIQLLREPQRVKLLFVKKSDDEGQSFYFLGSLTEALPPQDATITVSDARTGHEVSSPVVNFVFTLTSPVEPSLYEYLQTDASPSPQPSAQGRPPTG